VSQPLYLPPTGWVREHVVLAHVPFGRTKLRQEVAAGRFPAPRKFGERVIAYDAAAVHQWVQAQRPQPVGEAA
jgi:predicted DNA-binding transcriptional regulator AlpA